MNETEYLKKSLELVERPLIIDRTGVGAYFSKSPWLLEYEVPPGHYYSMTGRRMFPKSILTELWWFLSGSTKLSDLQKWNCSIWDEWAKDGQDDLGPIYSHQWRMWGGQIDQIKKLIAGLRENPVSRRHLVMTWNPLEFEQNWVALPPCHGVLIQAVYDGELHLRITMRSTDLMLGGPWNITSYSFFHELLANEVGMKKGLMTIVMNCPHLYANHVEGLKRWIEQDRELGTRKEHFKISATGAEIGEMNWRPNNVGYHDDCGIKLEMPEPSGDRIAFDVAV